MIWNTIATVLDAWSYPILFLWLLTGFIITFRGLEQFSKTADRERHIAWYIYPTVLNGLGILFLALAYLLFFTSHSVLFFAIRLIMVIGSVISVFGSALCIVSARRNAYLLPEKRSRKKQVQPKE